MEKWFNFSQTTSESVYLVKITQSENQYWEMLALFLKHLIPRLKIEEELTEENILEVIDMANYRTVIDMIWSGKNNFKGTL